MINPIQPNAGVVRSSDNTPAAGASPKGAAPASDVASQDTAQVSAFSQEYETFMNMLRGVPDVRPETVSQAKAAVHSSVGYPPLAIVSGFGNLVGNLPKTPEGS